MSDQDQFITVPITTLPNGTLVPEFQVAAYLSGHSNDAKLVISSQAAPWVEINFEESKAAAIAAGFKLITETQWLAIAQNIAGVDVNWTGGKVGEGSLFQGLREGDHDEAQPASAGPNEGDERRWFALSNGQRIWDFAGNAYSWVFDDIQGDENGLIAKEFTEDSPSISISASIAPSMKKGVGWYPRAGSDWSGRALVRGGCWDSGGGAGVFALDLGWPGYAGGVVGFRCTKPSSGL